MRLLWLAALSVFGCLAQNATPKFIYVAADYLVTSPNGCQPNSYIIGYTVDANTGALTPIAGSPFTSPGIAPVHITTDPLGRFVWVVNQKFDCSGSQVNGTIGAFRVDPATGALTPSGPLVSSDGFDPYWLTTDPTGKFAYVANGCVSFSSCPGLISVYAINQSDGTLTSVAGSPFAAQVALASSIAIDPAGKFAYVAGQSSISAFSIDPVTGALSVAAGPFPAQSPGPFGAGIGQDDIIVDPSGKFAIVLERCYNCLGSIADWSIGAGGSLTPLGLTSSLGVDTTFETIDPTGRFVFTTGCAGPTNPCQPGIVAGWHIDPASGAFTAIPGSPVPSQGADPFPLAADPSGKFLFVVNSFNTVFSACQEGNVASFAINQSSGELTPVPASPTPDLTPSVEYVTALGQTHASGVTLTGIQASANPATIPAGQTTQFTASGSLNDGTTEFLTASAIWTSSNTAVALISSAGVAMALSPGSTTVTACYNSLCGSATLTVTAGTSQGITLFPANVAFNGASTQPVTLTNSTSTALSNFTIRFGAPNAADFTETDNCGATLGASASCIVSVTFTPGATGARNAELDVVDGCNRIVTLASLTGGPTLASIAVTPASSSIAAGKTQQYTAIGTYADGSTQNITSTVTWNSSKTAIASINASGLATGVKAGGPINIQATLGTVTSNTALLTVTAPALVSIAVTPASTSVVVGNTVQFTATGTYSDGSTQNITNSATWTSSDTTIAGINAAGLATGVNAGGPVNIQASVGSIASNKALLTVTAPALASIAITPVSSSIIVGRTQRYTATATYGNGSMADITNSATWSSSNSAIAAIGPIGFAFGLTVGGPVTITASMGGIVSNSASLTVTAPPSGAVLGWGDNGIGQLGNGNFTNTNLPVPATNLTGVIAAGGGYLQDVALKSDGTVWSWGDNTYGQLGNGTNSGSDVPVLVPNLNAVIAVASGAWHSVAVKSNGTVWAWGWNFRGQLGNGTTTASNVPVQVTGLSGVIAVAAGTAHSIALKSDGTVWDWGYNGWGQLGNGSFNDSSVPVQVGGLTGIVALSVGTYSNLALKSDGTVWAWGADPYGELGDGSNTNKTVPVRVSGLNGVIAIAAGSEHGLALKSDGTISSWGRNEQGELGNGNTTTTNVPGPVGGLSGVVSLAAGHEHSLALKSDGTISAWGQNNYGELGNGTNTASSVPVPVLNAAAVVTIAGDSTSFHSVAITTARILISISVTPVNALVKPGGSQQFTAVGTWSDGSTQNITNTVTWTSSDSTIATIGTTGRATGARAGTVTLTASLASASGIAVLRVAVSGVAFAWGANDSGQLGIGTQANSDVPVLVSGVSGVVAVADGGAAGAGHSLALKSDGTASAWGGNSFGQLGNGTNNDSSVPVPVNVVKGAVAIAAGFQHSIALASDGTVWTWGDNEFGQLGNGTTTNGNVPVSVGGVSGVVAVAAGGDHTLVLKSDGSVWAWGLNSSGQLGNGTTTNSNGPVQVSGLTSVTAVAVGTSHSMALRADGTVWVWGDNTYGELGNGSNTPSNLPQQVATISGMIAINAVGSTSVALRSDGTLWDWGANDYGQLGNGTTNNSSSPVQVTGLATVASLGGGRSHSIAVTSDGSVWAWGRNTFGNLGDGTTTDRHIPVRVLNLAGVSAVGSGSEAQHSLAIITGHALLSISLTPLNALVTPGGSQQFTATGMYSDGSTQNITSAVTWSSSDATVGTVSAAGLAKGVKAGTVRITAALTGVSASAVLRVAVSGTVWAWGYNVFGELGNGSTTISNVPVPVGNLSGIVAVATGAVHSLAAKSDGTVWAWGGNASGQLGNGSITDSSVPVAVTGLARVVDVKAGNGHSLALTSDGRVWAWGDNTYDQLGTGNNSSANVPIPIPNLNGVVAISAGVYFSLALKADGTVWAWGLNTSGNLGNGSNVASNVPVQVSGLTGAVAIAAEGGSGLALKPDGTVSAWGDNTNGQLGNGTTMNSNVPVPVSGITGVVGLAAGASHGLALKSDGTVWAWGLNFSGQLGNASNTNSNVPVQVSGLTGVAALGSRIWGSLAVKSDGTVWAWGARDSCGFLCVTAPSNVPVQMSGFGGVVALSQGPTAFHSLAIVQPLVSISVTPGSASVAVGHTRPFTAIATFSGGSTGDITYLVTWSSSDPATATIGTSGLALGLKAGGPVMIRATLGGVSSNTASLTVTAAPSGTVFAWGFNSNGQLGNGNHGANADSNVPVPASGISGVVAVAGGGFHSLALKPDGTVWAWGGNFDGQLGVGSTTTRSDVPVQTTVLTGVVDVKAGGHHSLALKSDGTVWAWGTNTAGQLGTGNNTASSVPIPVPNLGGVVAISAGSYFNLAVKSDGTVWAWGFNGTGQLGNGTMTDSNVPVQVSGLTGVAAVAGGRDYSVALKSDGTVWAWGDNTSGELGNGSGTSSTVPVQVSSLAGIVGVAAGRDHAQALKSDGSVWRWGFDSPTPSIFITNNVVAVAEGLIDDYDLKSDGTVWAAGFDDVGELGDARSVFSFFSLVQVVNLIKVAAIGSGPEATHALAIVQPPVSINVTPPSTTVAVGSTRGFTAVGTWGDGSTRNITNMVTWSSSDSTVATIGGSGLALGLKAGGPVTISATLGGVSSNTASLTVAAAPSGTVWAWGFNADGQLGIGNNTSSIAPVEVGLSSVLTVAAGVSHSLALKSDGTVWAWGHNADGELGNASNTASNVPVQVAGLTGLVATAAGGGYSLGLKSDGTVWAWGFNFDGELGNGSNTNSNVPVQVAGLTGIVAVVAGASHSLALKSDGTVWAWGLNNLGQLGNGTATSSNVPAQVGGITGVIGLAAGIFHSLALRSDGTVWAWGDNFYGQLGNGTTTPVGTPGPVPTKVNSLTGVTAIGSSGSSSTALKSDGTEWNWGNGAVGELGNGSNANSDVPVQVSGLSAVVAISQGSAADHNLAISTGTTIRLTTAVSPTGAGTISPATGGYAVGSNVVVTATANPGFVFTRFSGALTGTVNPQTLTLNSDSAVTANFAPLQPALTASVGVRTDGATAGTRKVPITLLNSGAGTAGNATITSITGITVLGGSGSVSVLSGTPADLGTLASGNNATGAIVFSWPSSATRVRFTVNFTADGGYSGSTIITSFR